MISLDKLVHEILNGLFRTVLDCVSSGGVHTLDVLVDLVVISSLRCLVPEEVDLVVVLQMSETVSLVPAGWEHIERDLPSDRVGQAEV